MVQDKVFGIRDRIHDGLEVRMKIPYLHDTSDLELAPAEPKPMGLHIEKEKDLASNLKMRCRHAQRLLFQNHTLRLVFASLSFSGLPVSFYRMGASDGTLDMSISTPTMGAHQDHFRLGRL